MRRAAWAAVSVLAVLAVQPVGAQPPAGLTQPPQGPYVRPQVNPYARPPVSPYLNLLRSGLPGANYYNFVRTPQEFQAALQQLQTATGQLARAEEMQAIPLVTGHPTQFMTHSRYFFNLGGRMGTVTRPATMPQAVTPQAVLGTQRP